MSAHQSHLREDAGTCPVFVPDPQADRASETRHAKIEQLAHYLWLSAGQPTGRALSHWFVAEHVFHTARFLVR